MRVVFVSHSSVLEYHQQKLKILSKNYGVEIHLVTPPFWYEGGVKTQQFTGNSEIFYYKGKVFMLKNRMFHFYYNVKNLFKKIKPDILHIEEIPFSLVCWQFLKQAKKYNLKKIFFTWENIERKLNPVYKYFYKYSLENSDCAIAGNEDGKKILLKLGFNRKIYVMPQYGINFSDFKSEKKLLPEDGEDFKIAYMGRIVPEKGIEILLKSIEGLDKIKLMIAGVGEKDYEEKIKNIIKQKNLDKKIEWKGHIPSKDIPEFLNKMHILILPSVARPDWKEQFGRVLIEAFASKVAVIGSSSGEIPNVIGDAGLIFKEGDSDDLKEKIKLLLNDKNLYLQNIEKGLKRISENYTNDKIAEKVFSIYKELLNLK